MTPAEPILPSTPEQRWAALSAVAAHLGPLVGRPAPGPDAPLSVAAVAVASGHLVSPALGWTLASSEAPDDPLIAYFVASWELNRARNETILEGFERALAHLAAHGVAPVVMKGAAVLLRGVYPDIGARFVGDLDLLIAERDMPRALDALADAGFVAEDGPTLRWHHHLPAMIHPGSGVGIEPHRRPLFRTRIVTNDGLRRDAGLMSSSAGDAYLAPSPTEMVAQLIAHSQIGDANHHRAAVSLRYALDLARLVRRSGERIDWPDLIDRFTTAGHRRTLMMACAATDHFFGPHTPFADRAPQAAEWLRRGMTRSPARRWLAEMPYRFSNLPLILRHEPRQLIKAARWSTWAGRLGRPPSPW